MRIVSENTPEDIARNRASEQIRWALIELAANILRVIRGAGKPEQIDHQALRFVQATIDHQKIAGCLPHPSLYRAALSPESDDEFLSRVSIEERMECREKDVILRAALQIIASELLGQRTIQRTAENDLSMAVRRLADMYEERRRKMRAELRGPPKKRKARKVRPLVL